MQNPCYKNVKLSVIESRTDRQTEGRKYVLMYDRALYETCQWRGLVLSLLNFVPFRSVSQSIIIHTNNYI